MKLSLLILLGLLLQASATTLSRSQVTELAQGLISRSPFYFSQENYETLKSAIDSAKASHDSNFLVKLGIWDSYEEIMQEVDKAKTAHGQLDEQLKQKPCEPVDLRNESLGDVRDQGSIGWCFAYQAADLVSYELGKRVSARDIAQTHHSHKGFKNAKKFIGGGNSLLAAKLALEKGVCSEEDFPSDNEEYYDVNSKLFQLEEIFVELEKIKKQWEQENGKQKKPSNSYEAFLRYYKELIAETNESEYQDPLCDSFYLIKTILPEVDLGILQEAIAKDTYDTYIKTLFASQCNTKKLSRPGLEIKVTEVGGETSPLDALKVVDKVLLSEGKAGKPVGITYPYKMITDQNFLGSSGLHAGTIVARRPGQNGRCEYLVRNTWGRTYKRGLGDEEGNVWVTDAELLANALHYHHIQSAP